MTEAGNNPNCVTCEGTGRIEAYPDADIYAPCDECRPEDLKLWNAGYKAALADPDTVVVPRDVVLRGVAAWEEWIISRMTGDLNLEFEKARPVSDTIAELKRIVESGQDVISNMCDGVEAHPMPDDYIGIWVGCDFGHEDAQTVTYQGFSSLVSDAIADAKKAMVKHPQPNYTITKFAEESGEVVKAAVHCVEGRETAENLRSEMRQVIAMLYRLWVEGDAVHGLKPISALVGGKEG